MIPAFVRPSGSWSWNVTSAPWDPSQDELGRQLKNASQDHGHEVEPTRIPFDRDPDAFWPKLFEFQLANFSEVGELLVGTAPAICRAIGATPPRGASLPVL